MKENKLRIFVNNISKHLQDIRLRWKFFKIKS